MLLVALSFSDLLLGALVDSGLARRGSREGDTSNVTSCSPSTFCCIESAVTLLIFGVFEVLFQAPFSDGLECSFAAPPGTCWFVGGLGFDRNAQSLSSTSDAIELLSLPPVLLDCGRRR